MDQLSTSIDATYGDDAGDASVKQHQQDHDSLHEMFNNQNGRMFSIVNYGAAMDGATDDVVAWQDAVDAASAAGGGIVYAPPGTTKVNSAVFLKDNVTILMSEDTTVDGSGIAQNNNLFFTAGSEDTDVTLSADGNQGNKSITLSGAITVNPGDIVRLHSDKLIDPNDTETIGELHVVESYDGATNTLTFYAGLDDDYLVVDNASVVRVNMMENVAIIGGKIIANSANIKAVTARRVRNFKVKDVRFEGVNRTAVTLNTVLYGIMEGCEVIDSVESSYGYGVLVTGASTDITIRDCMFNRVRHGFTTGGLVVGGEPRRVLVQGCKVFYATTSALDTHAHGRYITFDSNHVYASDASGIATRNCQVKITNNYIHGAVQAGIKFRNHSNTPGDWVVAGNTMVNCDTGIRYYENLSTADTEETITISGNSVVNPVDQGIYIRSIGTAAIYNATISGNSVINAGAGAGIYVSNVVNFTISGNMIKGQTDGVRGVFAVDATDITISGTVCTGPGTATTNTSGIQVNNTVGVTITGNRLTNGAYGIVVDAGSSNGAVMGNVLTGNGTSLSNSGTNIIVNSADNGGDYNIV